MSTLEDLLQDTITPTHSAPANADWSSVVADGTRRGQRRSAATRVGLVVVAVVVILLQPSLFGGSADDFDLETLPPAEELPALGELYVGPTSADVFALAGGRAAADALTAWIVALGVPLLAASGMWMRTASVGGSAGLGWTRSSRLTRSAGAALAASTALVALLSVVLFFRYLPLAAQTGTSNLLLTLRAAATVLGWVIAAAVGGELLRQKRFVKELYVVYAAAAVIVSPVVTGLIAGGLDWQHSMAAERPGVGLWQLLMPGEATYFGPQGELWTSGAWLATIGAATIIFASACWARRLLTTRADQLVPGAQPSGPTAEGFSAGFFLIAVLGLVLWAVVGQDVRAHESLYVPSLPAEITAQGDVEIERSVDRNILDETTLFEIVISSEEVPITGVTNEELLAASPISQVAVNPDGAVLGPSGISVSEVWEIERDVERNTITLRAYRAWNTLGLNTVIYLSSLLLLAATNQRLRGRSTDQIPGRRSAGWFALGGVTLIAWRLVASLFRLRLDVGTGGSLRNLSPFGYRDDAYEGVPVSLFEMSGWFIFPGWPLGLAALAALGLRRLGHGRSVQLVVLLAWIAVGALVTSYFGELVGAWVDWLDIDT